MRQSADEVLSSADIWDGEWARTWKAHPANPWFAYEAGVYTAQLGIRGDRASRRALKTDAFDEACGRRCLTQALGAGVVLIDVSPRVLSHVAHAGFPGVVLCATDVRQLPFPTGTFDLILSTSTLDHFDRRGEIDAALWELQSVLRSNGRLLVTLDNPANPILRIRQLVYRIAGSIRGVIPFRMGHTLYQPALVTALEQAGFDVMESGYMIHVPRVLGLWTGEWAARRGSDRAASRLVAVFRWMERAAGALPTRRWTGHFIFADCRRRADVPARGELAARSERIPTWLSRWKLLEHRLRCAYVKSVPMPVLARVDPPLRRAIGLVRRAAAAPVYLHHPLTCWEGRSGEDRARVAIWGARHSRRPLFDILFDGELTAEPGAALGLPAITRGAATVAMGSDILIAHTTPAFAPAFRRAGFHIVPAMLRFTGERSALLATRAAPSKSLRSDLKQVKRAGYRVAHWSYTPERSQLFYHRFKLPHARARFGDKADVMDFSWVDRMFAAAGVGLALYAPGRDEPDVIDLFLVRGDVLSCMHLGCRDADPAILHAGGLSALYDAAICLADARGTRLLDMGRCLPWGSDGIFRYKWKWGFRPVYDPTQTFEYAVKVLRPESAVARRLVEHRVVVREGRRYRMLSLGDLNGR
ncbi:MAG: class I SAM-dependent methyltransferase [Deltaproteobacteria bacterium]|nr:class I SAM-dependent methyltransferase [Deltaproteobacteria bacterium]